MKSKNDSSNNIDNPFIFTANSEPLAKYIVKVAIKLWKAYHEKDLEQMVLENLKYFNDGVYYKIVSMGYNDGTTTNKILKNGHCYVALDLQSNIFYNDLACFFTNWWRGNVIMFNIAFTSMTQLHVYIMVEMIYLLQQWMI